MQVIVLLLLAASLWGQSQLTLSSPGAQPVTGASAVTVGANRGQNIYYWVVARTPSGYTAPSGVVAFNTVGIANLDSSNYVTISWNSVPLATGYDVIRSSTASYPASTSCASCAVVLNQAGVTFNDQGGALSAYPPGGSLGVTDATGTFTVDDLTEQYPFLNFQLKTSRYDYTTRMTDTRSQITPCTVVSGTANAIVCNGSAQSPTRPPIATLTGAGRLATVISLIPGTMNSGAVTINPDGLGTVTIQKLSSGSLTALSSGDLVAGVPYLIRYNGTVFVVDPGSGGSGGGGTTFAGVNAQTGTTYTFLSGDSGKLVTFTNGSAIAATLPQATGSFTTGWFVFVENRGAGTLTITPTTSTIDGASSIDLVTGKGIMIASDGTNYYTQRGMGLPVVADGTATIQVTTTGGQQQIGTTSIICTTSATCAPTGSQDFSGAASTRPAKVGSADPGTCAVGELFYNTTSSLLKRCDPVNTWAAVGSSASQTTGIVGGIMNSQLVVGAGALAPTSGRVYCGNYTPAINQTVTKLGLWQTVGLGAGNARFALYDSAGTLIVQSGAPTSSGNLLYASYSSQVLAAGTTYSLCFATDDASLNASKTFNAQSENSFYNIGATNIFYCANALSGTTMPATCGAKTAINNTDMMFLAAIQ